MTRRANSASLALLVFATLAAAAGVAQIPSRPDAKRTVGKPVPDVTLIGEDSTSFALSSLAGKPVIVSPIFTSCRETCPMITANLRDALAQIGEPGAGYQVLTVSFDPADGPAQLRAYRRTMALPAGWKLAVATPDNLKRLFEAIDFHYQPLEGGGFAHANMVAILTPTLNVSGYALGVTYESKDLRLALERATRESSLVWHYRPLIALVAALALAAAFVALVATRRKTSTA